MASQQAESGQGRATTYGAATLGDVEGHARWGWRLGALGVIGAVFVVAGRERERQTTPTRTTLRSFPLSCPAVFGYDVVSYFDGSVALSSAGVAGSPDHAARLATSFGDYTFYFSSDEHRRTFAADPWRYAPRLGGHCTRYYALGDSWREDPAGERLGMATRTSGAATVPVCVGDYPDEFWNATKVGTPWVIFDDRLYLFNCDATRAAGGGTSGGAGTAADLAETIATAEANWAAAFGESDGPFNTGDYCAWTTLGDNATKLDWNSNLVTCNSWPCLAAGSDAAAAWLEDPGATWTAGGVTALFNVSSANDTNR